MDSEQQINKELNRAEEQEQINHIHWLLTKHTRKDFFNGKNKEQEISEWVSHRQLYPQSRKRNFLSYMKAKDQSKQKRNSRYLDAFNQTQTNYFYKYQNLPEMGRRQQSNLPSPISPRKLNLKLPIPSFLEQYSTDPQSSEAKKSSLPIIRRLMIPVNFLKNLDRKPSKIEEQQQLYPLLLRGKSQSIAISSKIENEQTHRKGKMMGCTKRSIKGLKHFNCKSSRNSLQNNKLKQCITFLKS